MTTRIQPIGNSITWGYTTGAVMTPMSGYRGHEYGLFAAAGLDVGFIGQDIDPHGYGGHDSYPGRFIVQVQTDLPLVFAPYNPDIIQLMIGTNDLISPLTDDTFRAGINAAMTLLLDSIIVARPSARILVMQIPPTTTTVVSALGTANELIARYNADLVAICSGKAILIANPLAANVTDLVDGIHPTDLGYQKLAAAWYAAAVPLLPDELPGQIDVGVDVSWDGSGDFDGPYDDVTDAPIDIQTGIVLDTGRDGAQTLAPPKIGAGDFALYNDDGAYSQERADSPVYQRVLPGRPVRYRAGHGRARSYRSHTLYRTTLTYRGASVFPLGRHIVDDISQTTGWGDRRVRFATLGYEAVLTRATVTVALQANIRTDQAVTLILDAAGWPSDKRAISIGDSTLLYWWADERRPWDALLEILGAEGPGTFYVSRDGVFHWENRNYRTVTARSTTSQARFYDRHDAAQTAYRSHVPYRTHRRYRGRTSGLWFTALQYDPGFKNIVNRATYPTRRRALGSLAAVWSYGTSFDLNTSQSRTLIARPSTPFQEAVSPALTTDYTVTGGTVSVTLDATSGFVAFITVTATSGTPTVSGLQLRAKPLTVVSETTVQNSLDASVSIAKFSPIPGANIPIPLSLAGWPEIDPSTAEAVCDAWVSRYQVPRPLVTITLRNADDDHVRQILQRMPSDRITLSESNTGLSADVWINAEHVTIADPHGRTVTAVLGTEICDTLTGSVWDDPAALWNTAVWGR